MAVIGVLAYTRLSYLWNNWVFWLVASLVLIKIFRLSMSPALLVSSTISSMMYPSLEEIKKQDKPSSSLEEIESSTD